jgi:D-serine deaminase-like pyridoxal phosphate-dependent protein
VHFFHYNSRLSLSLYRALYRAILLSCILFIVAAITLYHGTIHSLYHCSSLSLSFDCASLVITRVISIVDKQTITTDLGYKSVAAESPLPRIYFLNAVDSLPISQSEEHLVVTVPSLANYKVGDILYGVPFHICPTVALYNTALLIKKNTVVDEWKVIARDRKISI